MQRASQLFLLLLLAGAGATARAMQLFAPAPIDAVSVRTLPAFTVLETAQTGSLTTVWKAGFRLGARYAALSRSNLNTPTILIFPDWDRRPTATGREVHLFMHCLLDPLPAFRPVRDAGASLQNEPAMTVACYASAGFYSPESFAAGLHHIEDYLRSHGIPKAGPPRYLYYSTTEWLPSWWRIGEVQVPIPSGSIVN